jgi:hypothetical protein
LETYDLAPYISEAYGSGPIQKPYSILDKMSFRALDSDFNATSLVDAYDSLIWTERYNEVGDFEIFGPSTNQLLDIASNSSYIFNTATSKLMIIEKTIFEYNEEDGNTITISGRSFESFLDRRIILKPKTIFNPTDRRFSQIVCDLVSEAFGNTIAARYFEDLEVVNGTAVGSVQIASNTALQFQMGENLLTIVSDICAAFSLGFKCEYSYTTGKIVFTMYEGSDYSVQSDNLIVFSDLYDDLISSKEDLQFGHLKTMALVAGNYEDETTGAPLLAQSVNLTSDTGLSRREMFVKADQEKVIYNANNTTTPLTDAQYAAALSAAGTNELNGVENKVIRNYEGEILELYHKYGEDFTLGDIIALWLPHGQVVRARLNGVTFSDDSSNGKTLAPSFNYDV